MAGPVGQPLRGACVRSRGDDRGERNRTAPVLGRGVVERVEFGADLVGVGVSELVEDVQGTLPGGVGGTPPAHR